MTKAQQSEREKYIADLRATLKPGDTLYTVLRHVSRSGMSRTIDVYRLHVNAIDGKPAREWLSYRVAKACDFAFERRSGKTEGIKIGGGGMDMGFAIVYTLGRVLWPEGFAVDGRGRNGDTSGRDTDGGYALKQEWL